MRCVGKQKRSDRISLDSALFLAPHVDEPAVNHTEHFGRFGHFIVPRLRLASRHLSPNLDAVLRRMIRSRTGPTNFLRRALPEEHDKIETEWGKWDDEHTRDLLEPERVGRPTVGIIGRNFLTEETRIELQGQKFRQSCGSLTYLICTVLSTPSKAFISSEFRAARIRPVTHVKH